jgi:hypothetical protein
VADFPDPLYALCAVIGTFLHACDSQSAQMTMHAEGPMFPALALNTSSAAVNYSEYATDISGLVSIIGRVKYVCSFSLPNIHRDLI